MSTNAIDTQTAKLVESGKTLSITASTVPQSVSAVPAERSIPPAMMIIVMPNAGTAISDALLMIPRQL